MFGNLQSSEKEKIKDTGKEAGGHSSDTADDTHNKKETSGAEPKIPDFFVVEALRFSLSDSRRPMRKNSRPSGGSDIGEKDALSQDQCICEFQFDRENNKIRIHVGVQIDGGDEVMDRYSADYAEAAGNTIDFYVPLNVSICNEIIAWLGLAQGIMQEKTQTKQENKT